MKYRLIVVIALAFILPIGASAQNKFDVQSIVQIQIFNLQEGQVVSFGSGINIGAGRILTNHHVVEDVLLHPDDYLAIVCATKYDQALPDCSYLASPYYQMGFPTKAEYSQELDLAVVNINWKFIDGKIVSTSSLPLKEIQDLHAIDLSILGYIMSGVKIGDEVQTLGYPAYTGGETITYSKGYIQNFRYDLWPMKGFTGANGIAITAPIGHGSSGGAALDKDGYLLGVTALCSVEIENDEVCYTGNIIPVSAINWWWEQILEHKVSNWFGYSYGSIPEQTGKEAVCLVAGKKYSPTLDKCTCTEGYSEDSSGNCQIIVQSLSCPTGQLPDNGQCITYDTGCKNTYGQYSVWSGKFETDGRFICDCPAGYGWATDNKSCITKTVTSPVVDLNLTRKMLGYILLDVQAHGEAWYVRPETSTRHYMKDGTVAYSMMRFFGAGISDTDINRIPLSNTTDEIKSASSVCYSNALANRMKGKILLQVQQHGEAYYVYPKNCRRVYLKDGAAAYEIMRYLGLGISNVDLWKIQAGQ